MRVEVQFPEEFQGAVMGQLNQRRGTIISTEKQEGFVQAMAEVPLNDMFGYSTDLRSATQGKGEFTMEFQKYAEVPKQQREVMMAEFRNKRGGGGCWRRGGQRGRVQRPGRPATRAGRRAATLDAASVALRAVDARVRSWDRAEAFLDRRAHALRDEATTAFAAALDGLHALLVRLADRGDRTLGPAFSTRLRAAPTRRLLARDPPRAALPAARLRRRQPAARAHARALDA